MGLTLNSVGDPTWTLYTEEMPMDMAISVVCDREGNVTIAPQARLVTLLKHPKLNRVTREISEKMWEAKIV